MFRCIPIFKGCNRHVEYVDKRHCSLTSVPDDIMRYARSLEEVLLDANHIHDLPKNFFRLVKLRRLGLSDNEIPRIPPDIQNFENLVELDVSRNDIPDIPDNIKALKSLQVADFSSNPIPKLPPGFTQLKNLTVLGLNDMSLTNLPLDFGSLVNLTSLELRENLLKSLPESVARLTKLERLDIGDNDIEELPCHIGELPALQELWLDHNQMSHLPAEIGKLKNLLCLDVSENRLEDIPDELAGLANLTDLHLSQNLVETLPAGIGQLAHLTICKLDQNRLMSLHPNVGRCESLQELILTENLLFELPTSIGNLTKLTNLNVDRNRLTHLPQEIGNLVSLGVLSLRDNKLTHLPVETGHCRSLHVLDVSGNRLQYLPMSITALSLKAVWLSENQAQPMLNFQTEVDEESSEEVLTCFLLPQEEYQHDGIGLNNSGAGGGESWVCDDDDDSLEDGTHGLDATRQSVVKFQEDQEDDPAKESNFVRHNTPHPRDLKARAEKLFGKGATPTPLPTGKQDTAAAVSNIGGGADTTYTITETTITEPAEAVSEPQPTLVAAAPQNATYTAPATPPASHRLSQQSDTESDEDESGSGSPDGRERRVGFAVQHSEGEDTGGQRSSGGGEGGDSDDEAHQRPSKLHRRDTPHHLKNKRISTANKTADLEKVASIIAQQQVALQQRNAGTDNTATDSEPDNRSIVSESGPTISSEMRRLSLRVERTSGGLGLSIAGGRGSTPYKGSDQGIFISRVAEGGPAYAAGLRVGDKVVSVSGVDVEEVDHYEAVNIMREAGAQLHLVVLREVTTLVPPSAMYKIPADDTAAPTYLTNNIDGARTPPSPVTNNHIRPMVNGGLPQPPATPQQLVNHQQQQQSYAQQQHTTPLQQQRQSFIQQQTPQLYDPSIVSSTPNGTDVRDGEPEMEVLTEMIYTTLVRTHEGLGFSIAGGAGAQQYKDGSDAIFINRINEGGAAAKDGKLAVGDRVISINGVDMEGARHDQAVSQLTGLDRFVRLVAQRDMLVPAGSGDRSTLSSASPRILGGPQPYTGLYNARSYMANRPSYTGYRRAQPTSRLAGATGQSTDSTLSNTGGNNSTSSAGNSSYLSNSSPYQPSPLSRTSVAATTAAAPPLTTNTTASSSTPGYTPTIAHTALAPQNSTSSSSPSSPYTSHPSNVNINNIINNNSSSSSSTNGGSGTSDIRHSTVHGGPTIEDSTTQDVVLVKDGGPMGLSIIGGSDHFCVPFGSSPDDPGIYVSKITAGGSAHRTGNLRMGDRILAVDGVDMAGATHQQAVMALLTPPSRITLTVRHDPQPPGLMEVIIKKTPGERLGMNIKGGVGGSPGNPLDKADEGIFISKINASGAANRDGRLRVGQRILEFNESSLLGCTHDEAVTTMRSAGATIRLVVCNGYDHNLVQQLKCEGKLGSDSRSTSQSVCSLDKFEREDPVNNRQVLDVVHAAEQLVHNATRPDSQASSVVLPAVDVAPPSPKKTTVVFGQQSLVLPPQQPKSAASEVEAALQDDPLLTAPPHPKAVSALVRVKEGEAAPVISPHRMTLKEKMKFFEEEMKEKPKEKKSFSYLSADEVHKMKEYEDRQLANMSSEQLSNLSRLDDDTLVNDLAQEFGVSSHSTVLEGAGSPAPSRIPRPNPATSPNSALKEAARAEFRDAVMSGAASAPRVRSANAERRAQQLLGADGSSEQTEEDAALSPADRRKRDAEKRAAWRRDRLKSLEKDAVEAQYVIDQINELSNNSCAPGGGNMSREPGDPVSYRH